MKIAYLINQYPWPSHTFIRREIAALERGGAQVLRFSIRPTDPLRDVVDPQDIAECSKTRSLLAQGRLQLARATIRAAIHRPRAFMRALRTAIVMARRSDRGILRHLAYLAEAALLCELLAAHEFPIDHVHAHFATNPATVALLCRLLGGPPYSFTIHGPEPFDRPTLLSLDRKVEHAAFVAAISDYARSQLCRWCDREHWKKIHVVRCGVDDSFLNPSKDDLSPGVPAEPRLLCIARLCEQKGLFVLIKAAAQLARNGVEFQLDILGDGPLRDDLEAAVREAGLQQTVHLHGWTAADEVRRRLLASRALVLPSLAEGLPIVLMEAMALGRPVIATNVGAIAELVQPCVHGWLIPPGNVEALAAAMTQALRMPAEPLAEMGRAGAAAVAEKHDCEKNARRLADLFRDAVSRTRSEPDLSHRHSGQYPDGRCVGRR